MHTARRFGRYFRGVLWLFLFIASMTHSGAAERAVSVDTARMRSVMAAYLVNFAVHVRWPETTDGEGAPLTIVVLGADRLGETLDRAAAGRTASGRPLRVVRLKRIEDFVAGDIVFLDSPAEGEAERVAQVLDGRPVLLVAFSDSREGTPAAVDLVLMEDGTLRYKLAVARMREAGLTPSAGLLQNALRGEERERLLGPGGSPP